MPLVNQSSRSIWWGGYNINDPDRTLAAPGYNDVLAAGQSVHIPYPGGRFQLEIRDRRPALFAPGTVLVAAGPPGQVGPLFRSSDTVVFDGTRLVVQTQVQRQVPGFLPSVHGFAFANRFPPRTPHGTFNVLGATIEIGDAANGLCGGMVMAVRDYFQAGLPRPDNPVSPLSGVLFQHLVRRLWDSFELPVAPLRYMTFMHPDSPAYDRVVASYVQAWPQIRADIDAGLPSPIGLVQVRSTDPLRMGGNHQVLVYGYRVDGSRVALRIYDPNHPGRDDLELGFNLDDPTVVVSSTMPVGGDGQIRAFFCHGYAFVPPPPPAEVPSSPVLPPRPALAAGASLVVEGNGWLGLLRIERLQGAQVNGTIYGQPFSGTWNASTRELQFTRSLGPGYEQRWSARLGSAADSFISGVFREITNGQPGATEYRWCAASRLPLDGNGWGGEMLFTQFDDQGVAGTVYGDRFHGTWNHATRELRFVRQGGDPAYAQRWVGRHTAALDFDGHFREVVGGQERPLDFRWLVRQR